MTYSVPFVPSPLAVVRRMLEISRAGPGDVLVDLGCGDGRIPIVALKEFGVDMAYCVEIREDLASQAHANAVSEGIYSRLDIIVGDMFTLDSIISSSTIVTLFLLTNVNEKLAPILARNLPPNARVVSHEFRIPSWKPVAHVRVNDGKVSHDIYLYEIPRSLPYVSALGAPQKSSASPALKKNDGSLHGP